MSSKRVARCLTEDMASVCRIFGKTFFKVTILNFNYKMVIVWQYILIL